MYSVLMLQTIITEATFSIWVLFHGHSRSREGESYLFNSSFGTNFFDQRVYGEVILKGKTNHAKLGEFGNTKWLIHLVNTFSSNMSTGNLETKIEKLFS